MEQFEPFVGARVVVARELATVRYIGQVAKQQGIWIGLEWDDSSRGKHDGTTGGIKYFSCESGQNAGSFVRAEKVNYGADLSKALVARYTNECAEGYDVARPDDMVIKTASNKPMQVNMVGEEKVKQRQSQLQLLTHARIVKAYVSHLGDAEEVRDAVPSLRELDVSDNLIATWGFAVSVCNALHNLELLNLSDNRIMLEAPAASPWPQLQLRTLILNRCNITWQQVVRLQRSLPQLQELHLCGNGISRLDCPELLAAVAQQEQQEQQQGDAQQAAGSSIFASLQVLNLEDNQVADWAQVELLAGLAHLRRLHLSCNPLQEVRYPSAAPQQQQQQQQRDQQAGHQQQQQPRQAFAALHALLLGSCQLRSWSSVDHLDLFPSLQELRISGNPLLEGAKSGGRFEVIGRVSGLTLLNGSDVKARERHDAELRYLQNIMSQLEQLSDAQERAAAQLQHPRLKPLLAHYGAVSGTSTASSTAGSALSCGLVSLLLVCPGGASHVRRLPRALSVANLRLLLERLCGVAADRQVLALRDAQGCVSELGTDDSRALSYYEVQDGASLIVGEEDPALRRRQMEEAAALQRSLQEGLIAAQLRDVNRLTAAASKLVV